MVIAGIPIVVDHSDLEGNVIKLFNAVCYHTINPRDIIACHRISQKSPRVLVKFINKKDAISLLDAKVVINNLNNEDIGLGFCEKLFVEEHLTPYIGNLAYLCRCLKRENKIIQTKVAKGIVKILKPGENGTLKWFDILHIDDIKKLFPETDN